MSRLSRRSFVLAGGAALVTAQTLLAVPEGGAQPAVADPHMQAAPNPSGANPYRFSLVGANDSPIAGGMVHRANKAAFPMLRGVAAFSLQLEPGAIRQPHLHVNANEMSYIASGRAGERQIFEVGPGEIAYQPTGWVHWLENVTDEPLFALFMYSHEQPETIDVPDVLPILPTRA